MTPEDFRRMALSFLEAVESAHMGHPDFRVGGKIFATLSHRGDEDWGMVKLTPEQQYDLMKGEPDVFVAASGAWGRSGCTMMCLKSAKKTITRQALTQAWRNVAPKSLLKTASTG